MHIPEDDRPTWGAQYGVFRLRRTHRLSGSTVDALRDADNNEVAFWYDRDSQQQWTTHMNKTLPMIAGKQSVTYDSLSLAKEAFRTSKSAMAIVLEWKTSARPDVVLSRKMSSVACAGCATEDNVNFTCKTCVEPVHYCADCVRTNGYHDAGKKFKCPKCQSVDGDSDDDEDDDEEEPNEAAAPAPEAAAPEAAAPAAAPEATAPAPEAAAPEAAAPAPKAAAPAPEAAADDDDEAAPGVTYDEVEAIDDDAAPAAPEAAAPTPDEDPAPEAATEAAAPAPDVEVEATPMEVEEEAATAGEGRCSRKKAAEKPADGRLPIITRARLTRGYCTRK
tara:strand:- start:203 stop:1204 length:1002 start_codon:yes stop_codon:yes gene_type:complete